MRERPLRVAVVSGDGLPVSGILTTLRNMLEEAIGRGLVGPSVPIDFGYSWRFDKPGFYPDGGRARYPSWLVPSASVPLGGTVAAGEELLAVRSAVARARTSSAAQLAALEARIERLTAPYEEHFTAWLADTDPDYVLALNMTLSDAVPVTRALHNAARARWGEGRPGGVVFWDHDLFGSYAVREGAERIYPAEPNPFTPLPREPFHRWVVVSPALQDEASRYPTPVRPTYLPNLLPAERPLDEVEDRVATFRDQLDVGPERPVVLAPVRIFPVKGVERSIALVDAMCTYAEERGVPKPCLLVFGALDEDPAYAAVLRRHVDDARHPEAFRLLDGVPLSSFQDERGSWRLDEVDLLRWCAQSGGGVVFTPPVADVESVGLGPALAGLAGVPCATTPFAAFDDVYGPGYHRILIAPGQGVRTAAAEFMEAIAGRRRGDAAVLAALRHNQRLVAERFPPEPWLRFLWDLVEDVRRSAQ
ncbi:MULTISPECIES: hypothetical protein [Bacteria]|uniref:hypothetical protein n=1 Tax=Bacteria TaxID=2 RepID=UPI003C7DB9ED